MTDNIKHYGTPRKSGRYPWGSGENPYQSGAHWLGEVAKLEKKGLTEVEIARGMGISTTQLRARKSIASAEKRKQDVAQALRLKDKGYSNVAIGERMGINESSVRSLLDPKIGERQAITQTTADMLKKNIDEKGVIDVGVGVENHLGISRTRLKTAIAILEEQGYEVHYVYVDQLGVPGKKTRVMVLGPKGMDYTDLYKDKTSIGVINDYSTDGGRTYLGLEPPKNVDSSRVQINYAEDGGNTKDGVIEIRPGVEDISLGGSKYAQVRIGIDGTHYLKGMAMYNDNLPEGVDIRFNTNKTKDVPPKEVFKSQKDDADNPFGAVVRQRHYTDKNGKKQLSAINIVHDEGDWSTWSKNLSSQMLSKQKPALAKKQLDLSYSMAKEEFDDIMSLTNPTVKKELLQKFADKVDADAVHLKAAAMPRQSTHVILPIDSLSEKEIYAPNFRDGERVALVRYPHGGIFEIPELTVNNKNKFGNKYLKQAPDAVGINSKVAERMSGADFDGDTVLVIPNNDGALKSSAPLANLKNFDPHEMYKAPKGSKPPKNATVQKEMGSVSNLITDMTIKGAPQNDIAAAVRHSMVVIDAEKHNLNYKQSYIDNNIANLKRRYQGGANKGASTLISRAESDYRVPRRTTRVDPKTGKKVHTPTGEHFIDKKTGKKVFPTEKSKRLAETDDAHTLSSGTVIESIYADYSNQMKALANETRKEAIATPPLKYSRAARNTYKPQVDSLNAKLNIALKNKPIERQAQLLANSVVDAKKKDNPDMTKEDLKKIKGQALNEARLRTGAKKQNIVVTPKEWEAIQAGAISDTNLRQILANSDIETIQKLATPRNKPAMSPARIARAQSMMNSGYTQAEVADALGVSVSTIARALE